MGQNICATVLLLRTIMWILLPQPGYGLNRDQADLQSGPSQNGWEPGHQLQVTFDPPELSKLWLHHKQKVYINCSMNNASYEQALNAYAAVPVETNVSYVAIITSRDPHIAVPVGHDYGPSNNRSSDIALLLQQNATSFFVMEAHTVGRVVLIIRISTFEDQDWEGNVSLPLTPLDTVAIAEYRVTVLRKRRMKDFIFDWVMAAIVMLNSFSIGCATDWPSLRMHFRQPTGLALAGCSQFLIMPTLSLALSKLMRLKPDLALGLFYVACVPGGGLGHVMVSIIQADRALSIAINTLATFLAIGTAPLWIFGMSRFFGTPEIDHAWHSFVIWLCIVAATYALGVFQRHYCLKCAEAFLTWFAKPFLLLYTILFITIGVYVNMYMFGVLETNVMFGAMLLPLCGYLSGNFLSCISRQESEHTRTIASESTVSNCLLVLVMVRFSLPQPDADIVSVMPIWALFMSPVPFILHKIYRHIKDCMYHRFVVKSRERKQSHFSIVSSLMNVTNVTTLSAGISPKLSSPADEQTCGIINHESLNNDTLVDEKVTVL